MRLFFLTDTINISHFAISFSIFTHMKEYLKPINYRLLTLNIIFLAQKFDSMNELNIKYLSYPKSRLDVETRWDDDVVLKNEGSMIQTCRNINVHVVNTDI